MMCCPRDDCPPVDGQWKRSSRGRRFRGGGSGAGGMRGWGELGIVWAAEERSGVIGGKKARGWAEGRCWRWLC